MRFSRVPGAVAALLLMLLNGSQLWAEDDKPDNSAHPAASLSFRSIGPASASGRISDIVVHPQSRAHWYVATASAGVWETRNAGTTWKPLFDNQDVYATGAMAMDPQDPMTLWVGSGENNTQRSVAAGDGIYVSRDGGQHWERRGLRDSGHISQIHIDPQDSDSLLVAAQGPLWSEGGERGLYGSEDGGESWNALLQIDAHTGVNEFAVHPENPQLIVASSYQRRRHVWTLINGGPGSGIHRSRDGGATWERVTSGLPGDVMGRIGLATTAAAPNRLYAIIEANDEEQGVYLSDDFGQNWRKQSDTMTTAPFYYNEIVGDPEDPDRVYLLDTWTHISEDAGKTFRHLGNADGARHVDDHALWVDPDATAHLLMGGDGGVYESWDRGVTWRHFENLPIVQFYRIQPDNAWLFYNVCGGTQDNNSLCGPSRSSTIHGITNSDWWVILGGDGYEAKIDPENPDIVYTQYQYGGLARYDRRSQERVFIAPVAPEGEDAYNFNWNTPLLISPHNPHRLYYAAEKLFRSDDRGDSWQAVSGDLTRGLDRNTLPVMGRLWSDNAIAKHDGTSRYGAIIGLHESALQEGLIYVGTDDGLLQVTEDGGATWRRVDSVRGVPDRSLIEDVHASAHSVDVAYAVVDNHKRADVSPYVLKTEDRGRSWRLISGDLPERGTVHTITEDPVDPNLLFVGTELGVYFTRDGGEHWTRLRAGLPTIAVRDLEIQAREQDLVVGSFGRGVYILDDYSPLRTPQAALDEAPATLFPIRDALQYIPGDKWGGGRNEHHGNGWWQADNPPFGALVTYHLRDGFVSAAKTRRKAEIELEQAGEDTPFPSWETLRAEDEEEAPSVLLSIRDADGELVRRLSVPAGQGLHRVAWDLRYRHPAKAGAEDEDSDGPPKGLLALPGTYSAELHARVEGELRAIAPPREFQVEALTLSPERAADPAALLAFQQRTARLLEAVDAAREQLSTLQEQLSLLDKAFQDSPGADETLHQQLRELQARRRALSQRLNGDRTRPSRNEGAPLSIRARAGRIRFMGWGSQAPVGGQQREQYAIASRQFDALMPDLRALLTDVEALAARATALGAPWSPGRLPAWPLDARN